MLSVMWRIWFGMLVVHEALIANDATQAELLLAAKSPYSLERLVVSRMESSFNYPRWFATLSDVLVI